MQRAISSIVSRVDVGLTVVTLLSLLIIQPLLQPGLPAAADFAIHLYRTMEFGQAWAPGVIIPRWAPNLAFGYGYPLFVFAPPLPYLLGVGLHGLGLTLETALKVILILTIVLYAGGMFLLVRDTLRSPQAGVVAGVAYAFAPFALREALLYGGNVPQYLAISLFPWSLWALTRSALNRSWGWGMLAALIYAGIILTHLFHAFVFSPVFAAYGILLFFVTGRRASTARAARFSDIRPLLRRSLPGYLPILALPMGLLLSAFFWLPASIERYATQAQSDIYLVKSPYYVRFPHWRELVAWIEPLDARAANPYVPLSLGVVTLILAALGLLTTIKLVLIARHRTASIANLPFLSILFFALTSLATIFMVLPISRPVWDQATFLHVAQFPWRLLGLANVGLAFLAGAAMLWLPEKERWAATAACVTLQIFAVAPLLYPVTAFAHYGQASIADQVNYERRSQSIGMTTLGEYLPQAVAEPPSTSPLVPAFQAGQFPERLDRTSLPPQATATRLGQDAVSHRYQIETPMAFTVRLYQYDYVGWRAWLDDQPLPLRPEPDTGFLLFDIPAGEHTLSVRFGETRLRLLSLLISAGTALGLAAITLWPKSHQRIPQSPTLRRSSGQVSNLPTFQPSSLPTFQTLILLLAILLVAFWLKPVLRPLFTRHSAPEQVLAAQHPLDVKFKQGIHLVGYDLPKRVVTPGEFVSVVLYWETDVAPLTLNLQPFVHLDRLNEWTTIADATNYTPGDVTTESNLPTFHWDTARYVRDEHDLIIPLTAAPQVYAVRVGLIDPDQADALWPLADGSGDTVQLGLINVAPSVDPAPLANPLQVTFAGPADAIDLKGFEISGQTSKQLAFSLAWYSKQTPQRDYTVFAQLLDMNQNLVASFDRSPLNGTYPTNTWLAGQTVIDPRFIPLTTLPPGTYRLIVGLYDSATQERLVTPKEADFIELTTVTIE